MLQWGRYERTRPGLKGHPEFADEPDEVTVTDYRYWLRLSPNPGFNLPLLGYWSRSRGKRRRP